MKKCFIVCLVTSALFSVSSSMSMMRSIAHRIRPMTPLLMRRLHTVSTQNRWPHYTREQADLIRDETLNANHLHPTDAYNAQILAGKIEAVTARLCPNHKASYGTRKECSTCWLPQKKAFWLVSEKLANKAS